MPDFKISPDTFIAVVFVKDAKMQKLNKKHLGRGYPTDVLAFSLDQKMEDGRFYLGDVVINLDQVKRQADANGESVEEEIGHLVEHGVLHLLGVHHKDTKKV